MKRPSRDIVYLGMADTFAGRSTCIRRKVGCILTDYWGKVLSCGYNGVPKGMGHCLIHPCYGKKARPEPGKDMDSCKAVHAEANALLQCADVSAIYTAYCTTFPCWECQKLLLNTSCQRILYLEPYFHEMLWNRQFRQVDIYED